MFRVSVITVCWNAKDVIEATLQSVLGQQLVNFEYLVIDGCSRDGTQEKIQPYLSQLAVYISEPDHGIYDAMNKGVRLARGDYVIFMNAGDRFVSPNVLAACLPMLDSADFVYGDVLVRFADGALHRKPAREPGGAQQGMLCSHQALFAKREWLVRAPFDLSYKIAADYEQILRSLSQGARVTRIPVVVAEVSAGGISDKRQELSVLEYIRAVRSNGQSRLSDRFVLYLMLLRVSITNCIKKILPEVAIRVYRQLRAARTSA